MKTLNTAFALIAAAASLTFAAAPAAAAEGLQLAVPYSAVEIGSEPGATAFADRLAREIGTVCGRQDSRTVSAVAQCRDTLIADAVDQLNSQGAAHAAATLAARV